MKSSRSRSRSKNNRNRTSGGNVINRVFDSSGPEGKVRGTPQQIIDKYNQLARDAQLSGDRVATENFQQHAEHYLRLLAEAQREQEARREEQERQNRERQAQRDRERQERMERQERESSPPTSDAPTDPSEAPQPDVIDPTAGESGLVETPEEGAAAPTPREDKPKPARKPRRSSTSRAKKAAESPEPVESDAEKAAPVEADAKPTEALSAAKPPPEAAE